MSDPVVSVVIPHYNDLGALDICLSALEAQDFSRDRFEIVVADNRSPVGLDAVRRTVAGRAQVVDVAQKGAGPARNGGVAAAEGEILAFTDADCVPEPGWLTAGVAALRSAGLVGGAMRVLVDNVERPTAAEAFEQVFAFNNARYIEQEGFTVTANLFVRRADFDRVGGFRTGVSEDVEWCHRARAAGLRLVYAPNAVVGHPARRSWPELKTKWMRIVQEMYQLACTRPGGQLRWLLRTWALPLSACIHLLKVWQSPLLPNARARALAAGMLVRMRLWRFVYQHRVAANLGRPGR